MKLHSVVLAVFVVGAALLGGAAHAQTYDYSVYVDSDNNSQTGCNESGFQGAEYRLDLSVSGGTTPSLAGTARSTCSGGAFGASSSLGGAAALGFDVGIAGADVIEFDTDEASLRRGPSALRVGVLASSDQGSDSLYTVDGGNGPAILFGQQFVPVPAIGIPLLALLAFALLVFGSRRSRSVQALAVLLLLSSVAWAAQHYSDGAVQDWSSGPRAQDAAGDSSSGQDQIDIRALFTGIEAGRVYWRIDVADIQSHLPTADAVSATTLEDAPVVITLTATDPDNLPLTFAVQAGPTQGSLGTIASTGPNSATVTYTPNADSNGSDSFSFTAGNGTLTSVPASVDVAVTAVNDAPSFTAQNPPAVNEDAGAQTALVASAIQPGPATATDEAGQTLSFVLVSNSNPALFAATPTFDAGGNLSYQPATNASGTADLVLALHDDGGTANGGVDSSASQTITVTVTAVNDAPVVSAGGTLGFSEGDADQVIDNGILVSDADSTTLTGATISISAGYQNGADVLSFPNAGSISGVWNAATGTLTLSGSDSATNYQAALRSVRYGNTSAAISSAPRTVSWVVTDGTDSSNVATSSIQVTAVNDAPVLSGSASLNYNENDPATTIFPAIIVADADNPTLASATVAIGSGFAAAEDVLDFSNDGSTMGNIAGSYNATSGALSLTSTGATATLAEWQAALRAVRYANSSDTPSTTTRSVSYVVNDGSDASNSLLAPITVVAINDAPVVVAGATLAYTEGDGAAVADAGVTVTDVDNATLASATIAVSANFVAGEDVLGFVNDATSMGDIASSYDGVTGTLTLTSPSATATLTEWQASLRAVTYANSSANPSASPRTLSWVVNDGSDDSTAATSTVTVASVNSAPSFVKGSDPVVNEDAGAQSIAGWATAISDGDGGGQTLTFQITGNSNPSLFSAAPAVAADGSLSYTPAADANGTATIELVLKDNGGTGSGGVDTSASQSFVITVNAVNDAPSFTAGPNQSVLENAGAQTVSNWAGAISTGPANESTQTASYQITSNSNAALFAVQPAIAADGTLSYTPAANTSGLATISVVAKDDGGTANGGQDTSAAQTFTISVLFVNNAPSFTAGGDVTVNEDSGAYGAVWASALDDGDPDVTQALSFTVSNDNTSLFSVQPAIGSAGQLSFTPAANASGSAQVSVTLHDNGGTANGGVDSSATVSFTLTVTPVNDAPTAAAHTLATHSGIAVTIGAADTGYLLKDGASDVDDPASELSVSSSFTAITPAGASVTLLDAATGSYRYDPPPGYSGGGSFSYSVCDDGAPVGPAQCASNTVTVSISGPVLWFVDPAAASNGVGRLSSPFNSLAALPTGRGVGSQIFVASGTDASGIVLKASEQLIGQGASGTFDTAFGVTAPSAGTLATRPSLGGAAPSIGDTVTLAQTAEVRGVAINSGAATGLLASNTTGFKVSESSVSSTTTAVDFSNSTAASAGVHLTTTTSTGGAYGINLVGVNGGPLDFGGGALSGHSTTAFSVSGSSAKIDYAGDISAAGGARPVEISSSSSQVNLSGEVSSSGRGVRLSGNLSGTVNFSGKLNLSTAAQTAFDASGGGTVSASATDSTLSTTTATALNVSGVTIGAAGLHFQTISAGTATAGPASGIVLANTGTAGGLVVHGSGSPVTVGSGGVIQRTSGPGVSLNATAKPSFHGVTIQNTAGSGIKGQAVSDFLFDRGRVTANGSAAGDSNLDFNDAGATTAVSGTFTVTDSSLNSALWHGIDIRNTAGTLTSLLIKGNVFTSLPAVVQSLGSAISVQMLGTASSVATIQQADISNNTIANFPSDGGILFHAGNSNAAGPVGNAGVLGSSTDVIRINGNQIRGASTATRMGTNAISAIINGKGQGNIEISGNGTTAAPLRDIAGTVILIGANGPAKTRFLVTNNVIEAHNSYSSNGIGGGATSLFAATDANDMSVEVSGNSIAKTDGNGILLVAAGGSDTLKASILSNTVQAPLSSFTEGIRVDSGNPGSTNETLCLDIRGNSTTGSTGGGVVTPGIGLRKQGAVANVNAFGIVGMASATASPGVENFVNAANSSAAGTFGVGGTDLISAQSGFSECSIP
ncbi:MAG TPA: Ig-like domain-containing protein [Rhodanobacteraceae bacterium]|nr:Ig-like domain-containing protein [Rhodanobacteraceae bacterium]